MDGPREPDRNSGTGENNRRYPVQMKSFISGMVQGEMMTKLFENILIATDGSENNRAAVEKGLAIARRCGSAVSVMYVMDTSMFDSAEPVVSPVSGDLFRMLEDEGKNAVEQVKKMAEGLDLKTFVIPGRPAHAITAFAEKNHVDLIVVGTSGKGGIERLLLGSVADKVIRTADKPVLVVRNMP
jgi:nucleotide-binding universal stress UspA family protein